MKTQVIRLHYQTIQELSKFGKFGQSWDEVLQEILKEIKN